DTPTSPDPPERRTHQAHRGEATSAVSLPHKHTTAYAAAAAAAASLHCSCLTAGTAGTRGKGTGTGTAQHNHSQRQARGREGGRRRGTERMKKRGGVRL